MNKIITGLMLLPLIFIISLEIANCSYNSPVGIFIILSSIVATIIIFAEDSNQDIKKRYPF